MNWLSPCGESNRIDLSGVKLELIMWPDLVGPCPANWPEGSALDRLADSAGLPKDVPEPRVGWEPRGLISFRVARWPELR